MGAVWTPVAMFKLAWIETATGTGSNRPFSMTNRMEMHWVKASA